ncbi:glycosyltransferase family 4 protein [Gleimia sp. 6138-11-ORH1]|uniref:glycosyltransferase family 4 protein n=1 Tax=Gleimia sp. 6138-11-ORH1 TaxID=2973937 RepID=UPI002169A9C7|nr:glycosyltransferase family 4 protein [Gleimia sp. 6138-11-ORH1]MCS4484931.1 glycosyltransferase family 4 protein [Gleimia sp. 6138-11-ORH1]
MKIAYVCADPGIPVFGTKGASVHIQEVIRQMLAKGHEVSVFAIRKGTEIPADLAHLPVRVYELSNELKKNPAQREDAQALAAEEIAKAISSENFDLVYERYSLFSSVLFQVRSTKPETKTILEVNAPLIEEQRKHRVLVKEELAQTCLQLQVSAADAVICVSDRVTAWVQAMVPAYAQKVHTVNNGVNPERITVQPEADEVVVTFVGTLKPWHGVEDLLKAYALKETAWKLRIIGAGPEEADLQRQAGELGLDVDFYGAVPPQEMPAALAGTAIGVAPYPIPQSPEEHYFSPLKIYEYLAAGLAVVATDVADIPELLDGCGVVVPASNPLALATAIDDLVINSQARHELQLLAREAAVTKHSWKQAVERIFALAGASL